MPTSTKPYLARALYDWMLDNELTPFVSLDTTISGVKVPLQYVKDGQIILNISPTATQDLRISNQKLSFMASFSGIVYSIDAPIRALTMIYAKETGQGMAFEAGVNEVYEGEGGDDGSKGGGPTKPPLSKGGNGKKPTLKVVK